MALKLLSGVILATTASLYGCAPWTTKPTAGYVTVDTDSRHDTELARKHYNAARKIMGKHLQGKKADLEKAEQLLKDALVSDVRFGPAHHSLGVLYFWQEKLYLAAWEFEYAARLMPDRFEPLNNLGLVYESVGKYEQAKGFYCLAREKAPNNPDIISNLARASFRAGDTVEEMYVVLQDILATDSRPEWRSWAAEKLGLNAAALAEMGMPETTRSHSNPAEPLEHEQVEELPIINAPATGSASALDEHTLPTDLPQLFSK